VVKRRLADLKWNAKSPLSMPPAADGCCTVSHEDNGRLCWLAVCSEQLEISIKSHLSPGVCGELQLPHCLPDVIASRYVKCG